MFELKRDLNSLPLTWLGRCVYFLSSYKRSNAKKISIVFFNSPYHLLKKNVYARPIIPTY